MEERCLHGGGGRTACLAAVRDHLYRGPIAEVIVALHEAEDGFTDAEDLARYEGRWETPLSCHFRVTWFSPMVLGRRAS